MRTNRIFLFATSPDILQQTNASQLLVGTPVELAARSLELGYDGFEFMPNPEDVPNLEPFLSALREAGAKMPVVNTGRMVRSGLTLFDSDPSVSARACDCFKRMIDFAAEVGADVGLGIARGPARADLSVEAMDTFVEQLFGDLALHAERAGTTILFEPGSIDVTNYALTVASVISWVDRIGSSAFGSMIDTQQLIDSETSIEKGVRAARGEASYLHLFDPGRQPPGLSPDGLDWLDFFRLMREEAFYGGAAVMLPSDGDIDSGARKVAEFLRTHFYP